jgi:class 3 adenylate cyclase
MAENVCPTCGATVGPDSRFCASCGARLAADDTLPHDELRPITALFADVVGSTGLGERLTPDEVKALIGECVTMMSRAVEEYGGVVQAYQGDGICAYFGVPAAHEDDPERAARAALRIIEVVSEYAHDIAIAWDVPDFNVRIGINSGQAAVGYVGANDPQAVALGDVTNVAARLQGQAAPGTIVVGAATERLLADRFVVESLGATTVKGREQAVRTYRLVQPRSLDVASTTAPIVGRDEELSQLHAAVDDLEAGRGQILLIDGEAGLGKTRLVRELQTLAGERVTWLEGQCLSYGGVTTWPFVQILMSWLGIEFGEPEIAARTKARAKLGALGVLDLDEALPAFGRLLRLRLSAGHEEAGDGGPDAVAARIRRAYVEWLAAIARERPVVLVVEDLHWADSSTRELVEALLEVADRAAVLFVLTQTVSPGTEGAALRLRVLGEYMHRASELALEPISDDAAGELLAAHLPGGVDDRTRAALISEAGGNPLYLEELVRALIESGGVEQRRRTWTITVSAAQLLPPTLENLLVARIDRLPEGARRLTEIAAVIGRTFPVSILERVGGRAEVERDLPTLLRAELVREVRRYPELECAFRHGLIQEAALSRLTAARRRDLYARVAAAYEQRYAPSLDDHLERLSHYHAQAENGRAALGYLERAAAHASAAGATTRAVELWTRAQRLASEIGDRAADERITRSLAAVGTS